MKENIEAYFQVGTILWMSYPPAMYGQSFGSYEDSLLKVLRDDFFSCIELTQIKDDKLRERVKHLLSQSHMKVCSVSSALFRPSSSISLGFKPVESSLGCAP